MSNRLRIFPIQLDTGERGAGEVLDDAFGGPTATNNPTGQKLAAQEAAFKRDRSADPDAAFKQEVAQATEPLAEEAQPPAPTQEPAQAPTPPAGDQPPETTPPPSGPTGEESGTGRDPESPGGEPPQAASGEDKEDEQVQSVLDKFGNKPAKLAKSWLHFRRGQTEAAEGKKKAEERTQELERRLESLDRIVDWTPEGEAIVKTEAAARALQARSQNAQAFRDPGQMTEKQAYQAIEARYRKQMEAKGWESESIDDAVRDLQPEFVREAKGEVQRMAQHRDTARIAINSEIGQIAQRHFNQHPDDKALLPQIEEFYGSLPEPVAAQAIVEGWFGGFSAIAGKIRTEANFEKAVRQAYKLGRQDRADEPQPADAGVPAGGGKAPRARAAGEDPDADFKDQILRAGGGDSVIGNLLGS